MVSAPGFPQRALKVVSHTDSAERYSFLFFIIDHTSHTHIHASMQTLQNAHSFLPAVQSKGRDIIQRGLLTEIRYNPIGGDPY